MDQIRFRKIDIEILLTTLQVLYEGGANYVDIVGKIGEEQDMIGLAVMEEYLEPDSELEAQYEEEVPKKKLTEDDINACLE